MADRALKKVYKAQHGSLVFDFEKRCTGCREVYPYDLEHFGKHSSRKSGISNVCRICERVRNMNKRANKVAPGQPALTAEAVRALLESSGLICMHCGVNCATGFELDHIRPLSRGGANSIDNLCVSCADCNTAKNDKTMPEYRAWLRRAANHLTLQEELEELLGPLPEGTLR